MKRVVGVVLIIIGVALVAWGYNIYDSASATIGRALSGDTPVEAWAGMVGGAIAIALGILRMK